MLSKEKVIRLHERQKNKQDTHTHTHTLPPRTLLKDGSHSVSKPYISRMVPSLHYISPRTEVDKSLKHSFIFALWALKLSSGCRKTQLYAGRFPAGHVIGNELRKLSAETSVRQRKKRMKKNGEDEAHKNQQTCKTVEWIWEEVKIPPGSRRQGFIIRISEQGGVGMWRLGATATAGYGPGLAQLLGPFCRGTSRTVGWPPWHSAHHLALRNSGELRRSLVVNIKCDILPFTHTNRKKDRQWDSVVKTQTKIYSI